ncbi:MAG: non-hydrolyzing UDP-N-acetylglucosamine 2-epimerase [Planctomycetaceae bacterium]
MTSQPGPTDVLLIAGARPNFMKIAPLMRAFAAVGLQQRLVHTGQHYDRLMSDTFFDELGIPPPDRNLGVGGGSAVRQIAEILQGLEVELQAHRPRITMVVGDVNSTLAAALAANKLGIPVAHVEAGLRSFDRQMPEEINRILTDALSDWLYVSEPSGLENLKQEGIPESRATLVGNVMIDTLFHQLEQARSGAPWKQLGVTPGNYALVTLHRPANVDDPARLESILRAMQAISRELPVLFALHPRTRSRMESFGFAARPSFQGFLTVDPLPYRDSLALLDSARLVLTDSGGLQEEACVLRVPCLTLRENTERPLTVAAGTNRLVGWKTDSILAAFGEILQGPPRIGTPPPLWDGKAAERIADHLRLVLG